MKAYFLKPVFHALILCSLLAAFFGAPAATPVRAASDSVQSIRPLMTVNAWNALGGGISGLTGSGSVRAIAINGTNLYIGGTFVDAAGDTNADRIAVWDGSSWSALGSGIGNGQVSSLAFNGSDLYVGGTFTDAGGNTAADYIAKWDGSNWSTLGDGLTSAVNAIAVSGSNIYVAGNFTNAGVDPNADYIAKMDGGTWAALGANPLNNAISALAVAGATVYAGGAFTDFAAGGNTNLSHIATWDGSWSAMGSGLNNSVSALTLVSGNLYVGGAFINAGGNPNADLIAKWDGVAWSALGSGLTSVSVNAIASSGSNVYVGGNFTDAGGDSNADYIARWDGSAWSALGATALNNTVSALLIDGLDLYAGGAFIDAGGNFNADRIARFQIDGTPPTVDTFAATSPSTSLSIPITAFTASDNLNVTGYKITESLTPPAASDTGWTASAPSTYTVASSGDYTLYPWAKDASGNISTVYGAPASVSVSCPATITVTSNADSGAGTLRQAIADLCADNGTINFNASLSGGTIRLNSTLTISKNLIIDGSALATKITISGDSDNNGSNDVSIFKVQSSATVTMNSLIVTKGKGDPSAGSVGGGIFNNSGTLTIMNSTFSGNSATAGGGIYNNAGTLTITNSTFSGNTVTSNGGGILNAAVMTVTDSTFSGNTTGGNGGGLYNSSSGTLTVTNSTISGNLASSWGGGIYTSNTLNLTNSTLSANTANNSAGGIFVNIGGTLNYANTIIANSTAGGDCVNSGTLGTNINNLVENGSCSASLSGDPKLGSLTNNGGSTQTLAPDLGSAAIDAGDDTICAASPVSNLDQRGVARPVGAHCDIGAYEGAIDISAPTVTAFTVSSPVASLNIPITNFTASDNGTVSAYLITESSSQPSAGAAGWTASAPTTYTVAGSGSYTLYPWAKDASGNISTVYNAPAAASSCVATISVTSSADSGAGTLRQAIAAICAGGTINFDSSLSGGTIRLGSTLTISKNLSIDGSALAAKITINGDSDNNGSGNVRVFKVENSATVTLDSLIVTKGADAIGSGIYTDGSNNNLTITNSIFVDNTSTGFGGGIYHETGTLTIMNSTFSGNSAGTAGGIYHEAGTLTIVNSTFSGNSAAYYGGAIYNDNGTLTIMNSTFSANTANNSGGGISVNSGGTLNYANTIIANSTAGGDCVNTGTLGTNIKNLVEDGSCSASLSGDPVLGALAANGGSTQTLALLAGSPAIDAGDDTTCAASPVNNLDQRGMTRPAGAHCDIGAYEYYADNTAPTITAFTVPSTSTNLEIPINTFSASDNTGVTDYLITESSTPPSTGDAGWTASAPTMYTVSSEDSYTLYPWAKDALGNVSAVYGSPASVSVDNTAPSVVSSVRASTNPTNAASVDFTVTFSESVTGVDTSDFALVGNGVSDVSFSGVTGSGTTRTVSVNTGSGDGSLRLALLNNNSIQDSAGNSLSSSFTNGESYTIDKTAPTLTAFSVPSASASLDIPITTFTASDNTGVTDYLITESSTPPTAGDSGWASSAPTTYAVSSEGSYTLYPWAKDAAGNVSAIDGSPASVSVDSSAPAVTAFTVPFTVTSLNIPITSFTASDNMTVAGYKITTSSIPPSAGAAGWDVSAPTTYAVASDGFYVLYPWVKDAAGNVSAIYDSPASVSVDISAPAVTDFTVPFTVTSLNIPITSFTASDNMTVVGYKITTSSVPPSAGAAGWDVSAPTTYAVASDGFYVLYPWVKDDAGNVSSVYGSPGAASVDATVPTVSSINLVTASPSAKVSVQFLVTFSEAVTGVTTTDFSLTTTGSITGSSITSVSAGTNTYTVTVNTGSGDGTLRLDIPNTATVTDLNGNALSGLPYISGQAYTINKTLIYTSTGSQDGWILESSETSNLGGTLNTAATTFRLGDDISKKQYRGILSFNTSSIPDNATITGVTLKIKKQGITGGGNPLSIFKGFMVDIKKGLFGAANLQAADFQAAASKMYGPLPSTLVSNWYSINLTTGNAYINKLSTNAGLTQLRLRFKLDDNNNAIANYLSLYSGNAPAASRPQLIVTYSTP